jgi:MSHA biogenesis protein MshL
MKLGWAAMAVTAVVLAACGQQPIKPASTHLRAEDAPAPGTIPAPVQITPVLPKPTPATPPETYSVVVSNVRAQELLFALARDAKLQIDIDPALTGTVSLNAIDQTLQQLLTRIARQVDMRYEIISGTLVVSRDTPFLRSYKVDYLSATRNVKMQSTASTQFGTGSGPTGASANTGTGATATIDVLAENRLWDSLVQNIRDILRETDRVLPAAAASFAAAPAPIAPPAVAGAPTPPPAPAPIPVSLFQEAASVIANRETGVLFVRATSRQHEKVQEFLDQVLAGARRQVLIEATVAEVQLRNEYQRGIEWTRLRSGRTGIELRQPQITPSTPASPGFSQSPFVIGYTSAGQNFSVTLRLLEQFGDVRVLSSPKLSVLNSQTAVLRVTRDIIYFTITPSTTTVAAGTGTVVPPATFTTTPNVAAEGFMMTVLPQINETDSIVLNVRPTIRRQVGVIQDPNPALRGTDAVTNLPFPQNNIPLFETREFDSILRLQNGEVGVLAGLMQDAVENTDTGIPGVRSIPIIGEALSQRSDLTRKTELVIFLRATIIRDPSVDGDFREFRALLPGEDFFAKPNPGRVAPPRGPSDLPAR